MNTPTKSDQIRDSYRDLDPAASSREIADHCHLKHGFKPSPQSIYETCGSEADRMIRSFNGGQLLDVKRTAKKSVRWRLFQVHVLRTGSIPICDVGTERTHTI